MDVKVKSNYNKNSSKNNKKKLNSSIKAYNSANKFHGCAKNNYKKFKKAYTNS